MSTSAAMTTSRESGPRRESGERSEGCLDDADAGAAKVEPPDEDEEGGASLKAGKLR